MRQQNVIVQLSAASAPLSAMNLLNLFFLKRLDLMAKTNDAENKLNHICYIDCIIKEFVCPNDNTNKLCPILLYPSA